MQWHPIPPHKDHTMQNRQHNNDKTQESGPNPGGMQMFNNSHNVTISKSVNKYNRHPGHMNGSNAIPSVSTYGKLNGPEYSSTQTHQDTTRIEPSLLSAFKENPYTQSLQSWA